MKYLDLMIAYPAAQNRPKSTVKYSTYEPILLNFASLSYLLCKIVDGNTHTIRNLFLYLQV